MSCQEYTMGLSAPSILPANQGIAQISPYQAGKPIDELKRELGLTDIVKLASNENPLGCSPQAMRAMQAALAEVGRYPDGNGFDLKSTISQLFDVNMNQITLGNGSNDILELVARTFLAAGNSAVYSQHAFAVYPLVVQAVGAVGIEVPAKDFGHDLSAMAKAVRDDTRVIFIANPNNPTGTWFDEDAFDAFMKQVPWNVLVVLDEAYVEYFPEQFDSLKFLKRHSNLLISRTLSKAYGLAALRVGFGLASADISDLLNRVRQPFNVNALALAAASAALQDQDFVEKSRQMNREGMAQLEAGLSELCLSWIPSRANFLSIKIAKRGERDGLAVFNALLKKGVIVRPVTNYGMPDYIRVSIGLPSENQRFLDALAQVLGLAPDDVA